MLKLAFGKTGETLSKLGLGCMGMSEFYGPADDSDSIKVIHRAIDLGCTHLDTADIYGMGHNETLVGKAINDRRDEVFLASKFGIVRDPNDPNKRSIDGSPDYLRQACDASLMRLKVDHLDLFYQHRPDPNTPIEETIEAMKNLVKAGKVRFLGLSEVSADLLRKACQVHPIAALQSEYSLWTRDIEAEILPACRELGVMLVAYSPLGRGFLSGQHAKQTQDPKDFRAHLPRFQGEHLERNNQLVKELSRLSAARGSTPSQVALAWVLQQGDDITAIPGTKRMKYLEENIAAADMQLSPEELQQLNDIFAPENVSGERYPPGFAPQVRKA